MDEWSPRTNPYHPEFGPGDPRNLENGRMYSLDNRRVWSYDVAGRTTIPAIWATPEEILEQRWKFTTQNQGTDIDVLWGQ
jgi:hypothetical protein